MSNFTINPYVFGAAGLTTLSFISSTTSNAQTVTAPATINPGDLLILFDNTDRLGSTPPSVVPTGFTQIVTYIGDDGFVFYRGLISYKIAIGNEDSSTITGMNLFFSGCYKCLLQFRGDIAITSITANSIDATYTEGDPASRVIPSASGIVPLIDFAEYFCNSDPINAATRTFSPAADGEINSSNFQYVKYKIYNSSPSDITADLGDNGGGNALSSFYLKVS